MVSSHADSAVSKAPSPVGDGAFGLFWSASWPAAETREHAGWLVRSSAGVTRRANSAVPLEDGRQAEELLSVMTALESYYAAHALPSVVQLPSAAKYGELDERLRARGYMAEAPTVLMQLSLAARAQLGDGSMNAEVTTWASPSSDWRELDHAMDAVHGGKAKVERRAIMLRVPSHYFELRIEGELAGIARLTTVQDAGGGVGVITCLGVSQAHRRMGHAARLLEACAKQAYLDGAGVLALQVLASNAPAIALYERAGFMRSGGYHYLVRSHD